MSGDFLAIVVFIATSAVPAALIWEAQLLTWWLQSVSLSDVAGMQLLRCRGLRWRWTCDVMVAAQCRHNILNIFSLVTLPLDVRRLAAQMLLFC